MYTRSSASEEGDAYTDLACERRRVDTDISGVSYRRGYASCGLWERIEITSEEGAESIGRPRGFYDTLLLPRFDLIDGEAIEDAKDEIASELSYLCGKMRITPEKVLAVGLGNSELTPDSVGCECARLIKPTKQIMDFDRDMFDALDCSQLTVFTPGVAHRTGFDSFEALKGLCERLTPDVVIAIDALASRSAERLGTTIQISSTGIIPGGGLGSPKMPLNEKTVGSPVIAVGVPTIMDANYFLTDDLMRTKGRSAMFVSPKEINEIVSVGAQIISGGVNRAFGLYA